MSNSNEAKLTELLLEQTKRFRAADSGLGQIEITLRDQGWTDATYKQLQIALESVTLDPRCQALFAQHREGRLSSGQLSQAISECKDVLTALASRVAVVEQIAGRLKNELAPKIDHGVRARVAIDAYRSAAETDPSDGETGGQTACHEQV